MKTNFADVKPTFQDESDTIGINDARNRAHDLLVFNLAQLLLPENQMRKSNFWITAQVFVVLVFVACPIHSRSQVEKTPYPAMAPLDQYLIPNQNAEIALARSAAPPSIADGATVMVLGRKGYTIAAKGSNGFLCYVERSWAEETDAPDFWNPKLRAPNCFNRPAARSVTQIYLMKTGLVLAGKSKAEIAQANRSGAQSQRTARAGAWGHVLHDVEATVSRRPG